MLRREPEYQTHSLLDPLQLSGGARVGARSPVSVLDPAVRPRRHPATPSLRLDNEEARRAEYQVIDLHGPRGTANQGVMDHDEIIRKTCELASNGSLRSSTSADAGNTCGRTAKTPPRDSSYQRRAYDNGLAVDCARSRRHIRQHAARDPPESCRDRERLPSRGRLPRTAQGF